MRTEMDGPGERPGAGAQAGGLQFMRSVVMGPNYIEGARDPDAPEISLDEQIRRFVAFVHSGDPANARHTEPPPERIYRTAEGEEVRRVAELLNPDRMRKILQLMVRHPGAPTAMLEIAAQPDALKRVQALIKYVATQAQQITLDNASDGGSATTYVSPVRVLEVMQRMNQGVVQSLTSEELQERARAEVVREVFALALDCTREVRDEARAWARDEMDERKRAVLEETAAASAGASEDRQAPPDDVGQPIIRRAPTASSAPAGTSSSPAANRPRGFGFGAMRSMPSG